LPPERVISPTSSKKFDPKYRRPSPKISKICGQVCVWQHSSTRSNNNNDRQWTKKHHPKRQRRLQVYNSVAHDKETFAGVSLAEADLKFSVQRPGSSVGTTSHLLNLQCVATHVSREAGNEVTRGLFLVLCVCVIQK
jgi:hypothetical protein